MANRHRGEIEANLGGKTWTLCLTLGALAELEAAYGAEDLLTIVERFENGRISARDAMPTGGFIVFALILLCGHGLNFALGIMSGVIHGLRLNLLEFYNWGIQDEGYAFKAFKKTGESPWNNS